MTHSIREGERLVPFTEMRSAGRSEGGERRTRRARVDQLHGGGCKLLLAKLGLQLFENEGRGMNDAGRLAAGGEGGGR